METSPTSSQHPGAGNSPLSKQTPSRACDRCRRRKAKCDYSANAEQRQTRCTKCRESGQQCRFDLPLARRGPKARKRQANSSPAAADDADSPPPRHPPQQLGDGRSPPTGLARTSVLPSFDKPSSPTPSGPPSAHWDISRSLNADLHLSPQTVRNSVADTAGSDGQTALHRWHALSSALAFISDNLEQFVTRCFDLFFEYLFPLTPLVHEPSLRDSLLYLTNGFSAAGGSSTGCDPSETWPDATFTLITAVCAEAAFLLPDDLFPEGQSVADIFLNASRKCLNHYLEADLESPNANSIAIRYFHSNCLHAAGKPKYSWHIFGEATRLAQVMNLHEEASLEGLLPVEAELRRRAFWIVYMGDKSAAILNNRPITIHKFSFESGITTKYPTGIEDEHSILSPGAGAATTPEVTWKTCIEGFNANLRLWQNASDLLLEMRLLQDQEERDISLSSQMPLATEDKRSRLDALYVRFITCLDDLPPYLQPYTFATLAGDANGPARANQILIQYANLQVSIHCLRMVITQKLEGLSYYAHGVEHADLRRTEIAWDALRVIHEAPFWSIKVNGEPYVEKIRLIGASLLEIIHRNGTSPVASRARSLFSVLLDLLTRLDSKASDALRNNPTWVG